MEAGEAGVRAVAFLIDFEVGLAGGGDVLVFVAEGEGFLDFLEIDEFFEDGVKELAVLDNEGYV